MNRYLIYGIIGFFWGAVGYFAIWIFWVPIIGWILVAPAMLAYYVGHALDLPIGEGGFGQYWNAGDAFYSGLFTSILLISISFFVSKYKAFRGTRLKDVSKKKELTP